jgi:hypothetical protein
MSRRSSEVRVLVAVALATLAVAGACGGSGGEKIVRERNGVRMTLSINDVAFETGDTVELSVEVENVRDDPLTYGFVLADEPALQLRVNSELGGDQIINSSDPPLGDSDLVLDAGDRIEADAEWDQTLAIYPVPVQAPGGEYTITARLLVDDPGGGGEPIEVTAAVTVAFMGGEEILPVAEAVRIAMQQPELRDWMAAREAVSVVCLYQPTTLFLLAFLSEDSVEETLPELYRVQLENGRAVCSPVSTGDEWRVQFFASSGRQPQSVAVYMDINSGENTRWEEGDLEPLATPAP